MPDSLGDLVPVVQPPPCDAAVRVVLHGRLRKLYGPEYHFRIRSPAEAIRTLCILKDGFRQTISEGEYRVVRGKPKQGASLDERGLHLRLAPGGEMHLYPVASGAGRGAGKIILGVVMVAAAFLAPYASPALFGAADLAAGVAGGSLLTAGTVFGIPVLAGVALMGGAMILGGISMALSPQPKTSTTASQDSRNSFLLGGDVNVSKQGVPVPVIYGRMMVASVVVSAGYEAADYTPTMDPTQPWEVSGFSGGKDVNVTGGGGGGKSGGGTQHTPTEAPNTLQSRATVKIIDLISEGPILGLADGAKSIFFDGTPLMAQDGTWNFQGVSWWVRYGWPDQDPVPGFAASEETVTVGTKVSHATPVTRTINSDTATAARITMQIPALYSIDQKSGDTNGTTVSYNISVRPSKSGPGGFVGPTSIMLQRDIAGKCTSPYQVSHRFELPMAGDGGANTWDVTVTRITPDSTSATLLNETDWALMSIITDYNLMYPDTAYIAIQFDAETFGSSIPTRKYVVDGRLLSVPYNYDPPSGTYASTGPGTTGGTWDAFSFKPAVTSNPAWIFYDMLSHPRYGCGIDGTKLQTARADLYLISQYCDGLVPDGFGGFERRYQVNAVITDQAEAYSVLQTIVSSFRGMTYWAFGQVMITCDMPKAPVKLVNQANVIDGNFEYQGTSLKTRHNLVRVTWRDPAHQYQAMVESVEDTADIAKRGVIATDLAAWGCTSRGIAHRVGKWMIYSEMHQTETVQYDAGLYALDLRPGEIFQQHDPMYFGLRWGGRLKPGSTQTVLQLDAPFDTGGGSSFTVSVVMPNGTMATSTFAPGSVVGSGDGTHSIVTLSAALPQVPMPNAEWIIIDNTVSPRLFQAVSIASADKNRFTVQAVLYDPQKFGVVEFNLAFAPLDYSKLPALIAAALAPPAHVSAFDYLTGVGNTTIVRVTVSWTPPQGDPRVAGFQVWAQGSSFQQIYPVNGAGTGTTDIDNLPVGTFTFSVRSVGRTGGVSAWITSDPVLVDGKADAPPAPLGLTARGGTRRVALSWEPVDRRDLKYYEVQRAPSTPAWQGAAGSYTTLAYIAGNYFTDNDNDTLFPHTSWWYQVRAVVTTDVVGPWSQPARGDTTLLIVDDLEDGIINTAKFASSIKPVALITSLGDPGTEGTIAFNEVDSKLYKYENGLWKPLLSFEEIEGQVTSDQIAALAAAKLTGQITTTQVADGAISTPKLLAGAVNTNALAAAAVTAEKLTVASASNLCWNHSMTQTADGWNYAGPIAAAGSVKGTVYDPLWRLAGDGSGFAQASRALAINEYIVFAWDPGFSDPGNPVGVPWQAGMVCEVQAMLLCHRCCALVGIQFCDATGKTTYAQYGGTRIVTPGPVGGPGFPPNGETLDQYKLSWVSAVAPPGTTRARAWIWMTNDGGADIPPQTLAPYVFFTHFSIGAGVPNAKAAQPWQAGGVVTIVGGMIKALSISADQLTANAVTAGKIAAGAVSATEIAAGQIRATHLASDFQLTRAAQIGTAVIGTAQIADLSVGTLKIANQAVTNVSWALSNKTAVTQAVVVTDGSPVLVMAIGNGGVAVDLGGFTVFPTGGFYRDGVPAFYTGNGVGYLDFPPAGAHVYTFAWDGNYGNTGTSFYWMDWATYFQPNAGINQILLITIKR